jgi:6-phosphogluconolactonase/glucosamine-6-phosphate isomerase/deaminase
MKFLRENQGDAVAAVTARLGKELETGKRVLWLVSGGSNVAAEVEIMATLRAQYEERLDQLAILPVDERYGEKGHADSNTQKLRKAGFDPGGATWVDVLEHNVPFEQTIDFYNEVATMALANASSIVGQLGMGDNGHIAGIQPGSPAVTADETTVAGFEWSDYMRLTLTPNALKRVKVAFLLTYGQNKKEILTKLQECEGEVSTFPGLLLYEIPEVFVYNDQIESEGNS